MGMASGSFGLAFAAAPPWFRVGAASNDRATGVAAIPVNAVETTFEVDLEVRTVVRAVRARELVPGTRFPIRCFERHIESEGWFCLGLADQVAIFDGQSATNWWGRLETFLRIQRTAARTGLWPEHHALSHGEAGLHHRNALDHARKAGLTDAYEAFMQGEASVLAVLDPLLRRAGDRLRNGRCACPCGRRRRDGHPVLRRRCPRREDVVGVLREERLRKGKLAEFVRSAKQSGMSCCGTMRECPLR